MADEKLTPERSVRLLRAKGGELEHRVLIESRSLDEPMTTLGTNMWAMAMMADIALIAQLLADHIEANEARWAKLMTLLQISTGDKESFREGFEEGRQPQ
jgi:hypothetical protein